MEPNQLLSIRLQPDQALVWVVPLDVTTDVYAGCEGLLSADEVARANRFVTDQLRRRFVVCRGRLRQLLAACLDTSPEKLAFHYAQWGKPYLSTSGPQFNVSHSADWALVSMSLSPVGIDLEVPERRINFRAIASQVLSDHERLWWQALPGPDRDLATLQLWVCKEALLKALGLGIADGLQQISFDRPGIAKGPVRPRYIDGALQLHLEEEASCGLNDWLQVDTWRVQMMDLVPDGHSALTVMRHIQDVQVSELPADQMTV